MLASDLSRELTIAAEALAAGDAEHAATHLVRVLPHAPNDPTTREVIANLMKHPAAPTTHLGVLARYADDFVATSKTKRDVDEAAQRVRNVLTRLGLELHPDKTRKADLSWGKEGFDFLGCHLRKRLSGPILESQGVKRFTSSSDRPAPGR